LAKIGDKVTLHIKTDTNVAAPYVTIDGNVATVAMDGNIMSWTATNQMVAGNSAGAVIFTIDFNDISGNAASQVTAVTAGGGAVTFDQVAPVINSVTIAAGCIRLAVL